MRSLDTRQKSRARAVFVACVCSSHQLEVSASSAFCGVSAPGGDRVNGPGQSAAHVLSTAGVYINSGGVASSWILLSTHRQPGCLLADRESTLNVSHH